MRTILLTVAFLACLGVTAGYAEPAEAGPDPAPVVGQQADPRPAPAPEPLSKEEISSLQQRTEDPPREVSGGALSNLHLTYIVIALATAVLVLVLK